LKSNKEIILHLPINLNELDNLSDIDLPNTSETINEGQSTISITNLDTNSNIFFKSNNYYSSSDDNYSEKEYNKIIKMKDKIIDELKKELRHYKDIIYENNGINKINCKKMNLDFIDLNGNKILFQKTDIVCWWCTEPFDT